MAPAQQPDEPLSVPARRIVEVGMGGWTLALVLVLIVPGWHSGERNWWPLTCGYGLGLGIIGWLYLWRGRGNAAGVDPGTTQSTPQDPSRQP